MGPSGVGGLIRPWCCEAGTGEPRKGPHLLEEDADGLHCLRSDNRAGRVDVGFVGVPGGRA